MDRKRVIQLKLELYRQLIEQEEKELKSWDMRLLKALEIDPDVQQEVKRLIEQQSQRRYDY